MQLPRQEGRIVVQAVFELKRAVHRIAMCESSSNDLVDLTGEWLAMPDEPRIAGKHIGRWERNVNEQVDFVCQRAATLDELVVSKEQVGGW